MPAAIYSARQVFHPAIHSNYLRDRKQFVKPAYTLPFNDEDYQQELEPQDYLALAKGAIYQAKDVLVDIWHRSAHW